MFNMTDQTIIIKDVLKILKYIGFDENQHNNFLEIYQKDYEKVGEDS